MSNKAKTIILLLLICVMIAVFPLILNKDSEFEGTDTAASKIVSEIDPDYEVWVDPLLEPPGSETESLLFCLQAAIGAGVFGYGIGVLKERSKHNKKAEG